MTVKQLFETYVYAEILSSVDLLPFVMMFPPGARLLRAGRQGQSFGSQ
jgi:hypothetical protein